MTNDLASNDPRSLFATAAAVGGATISAVRPDQLTGATPCDHYDVRTLIGHLVGVAQRVAHVGRGGSVLDVPEVLTGVADEGLLAAWTAAVDDAKAVWADDELLGRTFVLPWATLPGAAILGMYTNEVTVHTWDLAQATAQQPAFDDGVVAFSLGVMRQALPAEGRMASYEAAAQNMPEEERDFEPPFAEAVPVAASAPLIDQLVGWVGRTPA